ncbi:MAG: 4'-phosphopantetheinyl transferase superfamily protein [Bacteroidia bacterium]|nr:4'-phosphopantetheinyl transferase superfamily protein [Bacteroidia bacterium]
MPLRYAGQWEAIHWAVWKIEETEEELWRSASLDLSEQRTIQAIRHPRRRLESLAARAARRTLPSQEGFSLSHSFPWAAAATAPHPVGIDIERLRPFPLSVWLYFTEESERQDAINENLTHWHFWCAKELSYKILCQKYDKISFRKELRVRGEVVEFLRGSQQHLIRVHFVSTEEWLLGIGRPVEESFVG